MAAEMAKTPPEAIVPEERGNKFSSFLSTPIIEVTIANSKTFYLHSDLLTSASDRFSRSLNGAFQESKTKAIDVEDEDPALFGYFVEYMYRDSSLLSRAIKHYSEYVTLARLYAMGERLQAPKFQAHALWRFGQSLTNETFISQESVCELLRIACTEITERKEEDPMRKFIFWYAGVSLQDLQGNGLFRQTLREISDLGAQLCLWVDRPQPAKPSKPDDLDYLKFVPESEYNM